MQALRWRYCVVVTKLDICALNMLEGVDEALDEKVVGLCPSVCATFITTLNPKRHSHKRRAHHLQ